MPEHKEITTNLTTVAWAPGLGRGSVAVRMYWTDRDPLMIEMGLTPASLAEVVWGVGRELLAEGLNSSEPVGMSDVKVRRTSPHAMMVTLSSPEGECHVRFPAELVASYLGRIDAVMPPGGTTEALAITHAVEEFIESLGQGERP